MAIIAVTGIFMLSSFSKSRINLNESTSSVIAQIRDAQTRAINSTSFKSSNRCGYGVHYMNSKTIQVFVGPDAAPANSCTSFTRQQDDPLAEILTTNSLNDRRMEIKQSFQDIFFEPPTPRTYFNNIYVLNTSQPIIIGVIDQSCTTASCQTICVYASGKIETLAGSTSCP